MSRFVARGRFCTYLRPDTGCSSSPPAAWTCAGESSEQKTEDSEKEKEKEEKEKKCLGPNQLVK